MKQIHRSALSAAVVLALAASAGARAEDAPAAPDAGAAPAAAPAAPAAAPADSKPKGPTLADILGNSAIDVKGYLDASYIAHSQTPNSSVQVFDTAKNSFGLHQAGITISSTPKEGFGGVLNLTAGSDAGIFCSYGACATAGNTAGSGGNFDLTQAYAQYASGMWTFIGGKFTTLAGAEVIDSSADTNITRSILFGKIPFTHTGVRATAALSDSTNLIMGVNNGWDQVTDMNSSKTAELGLTTAFTKDTSLALSLYSGNESMQPATYSMVASAVPGAINGTRTLIDAVFTSNLTSTTTFILNGDHVSQDNVFGVGTEKYWGLAAYLNYQMTDKLRWSLRGEEFRDDSGVSVATPVTPAGSNTLKEVTLTVGYAPVKNFEMRGEVRADHADKGVFLDSSGLPQTSMTTVGVQGIYKF